MFVSASTECYPDLSPPEVIETLIDLEYTAVELALHETGGWLRPAEIVGDVERAAHVCRDTHRLAIAALSVEIEAEGEAYYQQFEAISKVAKLIKVVPLVIPAAELGAPFNE